MFVDVGFFLVQSVFMTFMKLFFFESGGVLKLQRYTHGVAAILVLKSS